MDHDDPLAVRLLEHGRKQRQSGKSYQGPERRGKSPAPALHVVQALLARNPIRRASRVFTTSDPR